jgi:hypothetical protein
MRYELGSIARDLLEDLERTRPGFPDDEAGFREAVQARARLRLGEDLRRQYASLGADGDYQRVEREVREVLVPRYVAFALPYTRLERHGGGAWRGGDLVARVVLALIGLSVGGFIVWAPFIPVWEKWLPFVLMILAPFLPDLQRAWHRASYQARVSALARDMEAAAHALIRSDPLDLGDAGALPVSARLGEQVTERPSEQTGAHKDSGR